MLQFKKHLCNPHAFSGMKLFSATRKVASSDFAKKMAMFVVMFMLVAIDTWASSTGAGGFTKATTEISSYQTPVANLMKAIAAVIVLVGAFNVYFKMQNGDQDVKNILVLQNRQETRRKEMKHKLLDTKELCRYFDFPIFENMVLKNI